MSEPHLLAFVDAISASPTVRLDLSGGTQGPFNLRDGSRFDPPPLKRSVPSSYLADGGTPNAAAFDNRTIELVLQMQSGGILMNPDLSATYIQQLQRELDRPTNVLRYQAGTSSPVFFRTFRAGPEQVEFHPTNRQLTISLLAEPFAYGPRETVSALLLGNDPAEGPTLNSNPTFEVTASPWAANGGSSTIARSTIVFYSGIAGLTLTPDGSTANVDARSENVAATVGVVYRGTAWVRIGTTRNVGININWRDAGASLLSTSTSTVSVTANTWTRLVVEATAPASTTQAQLTLSMGSTPSASFPLTIDEARIRSVGNTTGLCFDITSPKGDIETPLYLSITGANGVADRLTTAIAVRRRGTVSALPLVLQAEAMTQNVDTTTQANSTSFSGTGNNYSRTTFASFATMQTRIYTSAFPATPSVDARGTYRVFLRCRKNTGGDTVEVRLRWGSSMSVVLATNDTVDVGTDTQLKYVDLGLVQIPVGFDPVTDGLGAELPAEGIYIAVQVVRQAGSGTFDMDCLLFVPVDDRAMFIKLPDAQTNTSDAFIIEGGSRPAVYALTAAGNITSTIPPEISGTGLMITPGRTNRIVYARDLGLGRAAVSGDDLTVGTTITPYYYPRYLSPVRPISS